MNFRSIDLLIVCGAVVLLFAGCDELATSPASAVAKLPAGPPVPPPPPDVAPVSSPVASDEAAAPAFTDDSGFAPAGETEAIPATGAGSDESQVAVSQAAFDAPTPSAASNPVPAAIHLSAGVALPQLLPEGTQIGVSVDYAVRGELKSSSRYVLAVESSAGEIAMEVKLEPAGGTIQGFLPLSVRPEHKPFRARIDELPAGGKAAKVSNSAVLATSY